MSADSQIMQAIAEQYGAALKMLENTIVECDEDLWQDTSKDTVICQIAYHILFFIDLYLSENKSEIDSFNGKYGDDGLSFHEPDKYFTKEQLTTYLQEIREKAEKKFNSFSIKQLNQEPVFDWHGSSVLSSLLYNLRHIMLHVGALHVRVNRPGKMPLRWVSKIPEDEGKEKGDIALWHLQNGNLSEAEKIYTDLCAGSENPTLYYNLACCFSLQNKIDQSVSTLETCLKFDKSGRFKHAAHSDKDFTNIRASPKFIQLLK